MREIKFRAWSRNNQKMYFVAHTVGCLTTNGSYWHVEQGENKKASSTHGDILMQYTGLRDENNKEIYEGDILQSAFCGIRRRRLVLFKDGMYQGENLIRNNDYSNNVFPIESGDKWAVIGNIYENPELLGGE